MADNKKKQSSGVVSAVSAITHMGVTIAACVFVGVFIGRFLDRLLETSPGFLIIFSLLGVVSAFITIVKVHVIMPQNAETKTNDTDAAQQTDDPGDEGEE